MGASGSGCPIGGAGRRHGRRRRRGSVYVVVLGAAMLVTVIGLGTWAVVRAQALTSDTLSDVAEARQCAVSAVELARLWIAQDPNWRTNRANGVWAADQPLGQGKYTLEVVNPSGPLNNSETDPVTVTATGVRGRARQKVQVTLAPRVTPLTCLNAAVSSGGSIVLSAATLSGLNQTVASNAGVTAILAKVYANVEASGTILGLTYYGTTKAGVPARALPNAGVFDYYLARGTAIAITSLPLASGFRKITQVVLSPACNPFGGATNAQGIYVIDCLGNNVDVVDCRIVGTLVLLNPGGGSLVQDSVNWCPAVSGFPCLLVKGAMSLKYKNAALAEGGSLNYNPPGTPYPWPSGASNTTFTDTYPSRISGLVYISGNVTTATYPTLGLLVCGGSLVSSNDLCLIYDPGYYRNPPPGFRTIQMVVAPGSFKQAVDP